MLNKASSSLSADSPSSSVIREILLFSDDDHASVPSPGSGNDDGRLREMASLEKLISAEQTFMQALPGTLSRQQGEMSEAFAAFQKAKEECGVVELRRMKKLVLQWRRKLVDSPYNNIPIRNPLFANNIVYDMPPIFEKSTFFRDFQIRYYRY